MSTAESSPASAVRIGLLIALITALAAASIAVLAPPGAATMSGPNPPLGVHLSYVDDPTKAVATWHTASSSTSRVEWGTAIGPPYPNGATGSDYSSNGGSFLHTATMTGLTPGTVYYYRVGDSLMSSWFGQGSFRAAPSVGDSGTFIFTAAGDFGNSENTQATANAMAAANPALATLLGDYYYTMTESTVRAVWEKFQALGEKAFVMNAIGNHEYSDPAPIDNHCAFVNLPGNERTFAFTYGKAFFVSVDWGTSTTGTADGVDGTGAPCGGAAGTTAIRSWVDARLAEANANPNIVWKIVFQHFQCYLTDTDKTSALCPDGTGDPDQIEDILVNRGVDLVLTAHAHTYGRTYPVRFNTVLQTGNTYDRPGAPIYLVIGTGGQADVATCRTEPYIAVCRATTATRGYGKFTVRPHNISYEFVENSLGVIDSFTLIKTPPNDFEIAVSPSALTLGRNAQGTATVTVSGASNGSVSLSETGCPADTACPFAPPSGTVPFTSTMTVTTSATSPYGTHPMTVVGTNATKSKSASFTLTIAERFTLSFQKGDGGAYSETDDTYITSSGSNTNYGAETRLRVDAAGCPSGSSVCKTLIKFPDFLGSSSRQVPMGSSIHDSILEFTVTNPGGTQRFYRVTEVWQEMTATWNSFAVPGNPGNAGQAGSYAAPTGRIRANITTVVQEWANGQANQGLLIDSASSDGVEYTSSEGMAITDRPKLLVTFSPGGPQSFDFSMAASPTLGNTAPGGSVSTTVTSTLLSGLTEPVAFSCADLPEGATCTYVPTSCSPTCSTSLAIQTSPSTPLGTHVIRLVGASSTISRETTYSLTVSSTATLSFQRGDGGLYSETDDTYIVRTFPTTNYGTQTRFSVDAKDCVSRTGVCKSLLKFPSFLGPNPGQVPLGSTILTATLEVSVFDAGGTQNAFRLIETWGELTATWNSFAVPGNPATSGPPITYSSPTGRLSLDVKGMVQDWANGALNQGWLITTTSSNGAHYDSSEASFANRPELTVTFQPPPGPGSSPVPQFPPGDVATLALLPMAVLALSAYRRLPASVRRRGGSYSPM